MSEVRLYLSPFHTLVSVSQDQGCLVHKKQIPSKRRVFVDGVVNFSRNVPPNVFPAILPK